jgi:hypothetical protein
VGSDRVGSGRVRSAMVGYKVGLLVGQGRIMSGRWVRLGRVGSGRLS